MGGPEQDATPPGQRARDLLAVLLVRRNQAVDPMVLLDLVWGSEAALLDTSVVHTVVARLRRTLGRDAIETTGRGYRLHPDVTDEDAFVDLVEQAQRARHDKPDRAITLLKDALALWRADRAYADVTAELVAAEVGRLRERRSVATEVLAGLLLARGTKSDIEELILLADAFAAREPMLEHAHELLMLGLWRAGRQADALAAYERLRLMLRDELGVDPSSSTSRLHLQMLTQDPELDAGPARSVRPPRAAPPAPTTPLIGREAELATVLDLLTERRLVVVTGLGGVGKSRLLSEVHRRLDEGTESAFLDLATLDVLATDDLVAEFGHALGLQLDAADPLGSLARSLARQELLLLVDEAERSATSLAAILGELLGRCPGLRVLVASRRPVGVVGESLVALDPLPVPAEDAEIEAIAATASVRLLRARITDRAPRLTLGDDETLLLGRLARRADGLPLALELLAGYAGTHSLDELDSVLDAPNNLTSDDEGRPARHRTLRDTILWSVERLPGGHRKLLRRLGIFNGSFDLSAGLAVVGADCEDVDRTGRALVREGLIQARREDDTLLLRLPRVVRDLAVEELVEHDELRDARLRHRRWHATELWRDELRSDALLADMRHHYADYLAALRTGLEDRDGESVGAIALTLGRFWGFANTVQAGARWFEEVLMSGLVSPTVEARIRTMRANVAVHHDPAGSLEDLDAALPILIAEADAPFLVTAYILRSLERYESGHREESVAAAMEAVRWSGEATPERRADALGILALAQASLDPSAASESAREAWSLAAGSGNPASRASVATNVGLALLELGRAEEAITLFHRAIADMGDDVPLFLVYNSAWAELQCGDAAPALAGFAQVVADCGDVVGDRNAAEAVAGAACALSDLGRPEAAELLAGAAELVSRTGLAMQHFQTDRLERGLHESPWGGLAWPATPQALGRHLASVLSAAVARLTVDQVGQTTGGNGT